MIKKLLIILYILLVVTGAAIVAGRLWATPTYTQQKAADKAGVKTSPAQAATFLAVGDIMLSRNVAAAIKKANDPVLPFRSLDSLLKSTDFNFANLESPINGKDYFSPSPSLIFNAPTYTLKGLTDYNFRVLNLANNHTMDQDKKGLDTTAQYLDERGITHLGTGDDQQEAWQGKIVTINGIKIGFIGASYASLNDNGKTKNDYLARIEDLDVLNATAVKLRTQVDYLIVTMHAGQEYTREPNQDQIDFAHAAIDAGADLVIGAHPHWVQTIERYAPKCPSPGDGEGAPSGSEGRERSNCGTPKYIFYSLGNFVFDQMWSQDTREGLMLKIQVTRDKLQGPVRLEQIELIPVIIDNFCCPRVATDEEAQAMLKKINQTSTILK